MKNDPANPYITASELCAAMAQRNAEHMAGLGVTMALAQFVGLKEIDGLPLQKWYMRQRGLELEQVLIAFEATDPALAARLQRQIDDWNTAPESN